VTAALRTAAGALGALLGLLALTAAAQTPARPHYANRADTAIVAGQDLDEIVERGYAEIGVYADFPPWSWAGPDGAPMGVDVALGRIVAEALGVEARIRLVAAGESVDGDLRDHVWRGTVVGDPVVNVLMHVPVDRDFALRNELVVMTGAYARERIGLAWRAEAFPDGPPTPAHFRFDRVAVENDSLADFYLTSFAGGSLVPNMTRRPTTEAAVGALRAGEVAAAMGPVNQLEWAAAGAEGLVVGTPPLVGLAKGEWTIGVAVRHTFRPLAYAVDDALRAAAADGRVAEIFAAHGLTWRAP
jgi:ABC-type amino acid transport substrate-binding protein